MHHAPDGVKSAVVRSSLEEEDVTGPLMRRYSPFPVLSFFVQPLMAFLITLVAHFMPSNPTENPSSGIPSGTSPGAQSGMGKFPKGSGGDTLSTLVPPQEHGERFVALLVPTSDYTVVPLKSLSLSLSPRSPAEPSVSSKRKGSPPEPGLKDLKKHKVQEERTLRHRLKALTRDYDSLKERYAANVCKTDSLLAEGCESREELFPT
ncbi:hypothetical protein LIER_31020 [Lithospermum erythrorhizon]|uniref:Uncharacterized protein n=1 Tax=Lithospermum erythrorhizon TaxID=34254 RepID=A0AAV3RPN3_LITER